MLTDTETRPAPVVAPTVPIPRGAARPAQARLVLEMLAVGGIAILLAAWLYQLWTRTLSVPLENVYDARQTGASIKAIIEHGLFSSNGSLGAPFGKDRFDWPVAGELIQRSMLWVLTRFSSRFGIVMNAYYLLGFALVAAAAHAVLRVLRFPVTIAAGMAVLYAFLPYHFFHGEAHLLRAAYYSAPLAVLVMLAVLDFRGCLLRDPDAPLRPWASLRTSVRWPRVVALLALVSVIALSETMVTFFTAAVLLVAGVVVAVRDRSPAIFLPVGAVVATLAIVFAIALVPNVVYWSQHGRNARAVHRIPAEQELYGLRPSQMFLPIENHRIAALRDIQTRANDRSPVAFEGGQQLGVIGALGLVVLLYTAIARGVVVRARRPLTDRVAMLRTNALLVLLLILMGTVSGLAMLAALAGFTEVRTWNRVVVLIAFLALLTVATGLEWCRTRLGPARRWVAGLLTVAVVAFGLWDTARPLRSDQARQVPVAEAMQSVVRRIEQTLPRDAAVFQLPVIPYPEYRAQVGRVFDYEELLPYLWSDHVRWSYGGTKGRPQADWQQRVSSTDPAASLAGLVGLGFDGILLDTWVYDDAGVAAMASLVPALGQPSITAGRDSRFRFWDLRGYQRRAGLSDAAVRRAARALVGPRLLADLPARTG